MSTARQQAPHYRVTVTQALEYDGSPFEAASAVMYSITHDHDPVLIMVENLDENTVVSVDSSKLLDY